MPKKGMRDTEMNRYYGTDVHYIEAAIKKFLRSRSHSSKCMFTLQIHPKITKSEEPPFPGVAMWFGKVMKEMNHQIHWQGNMSFWTHFCNWNCTGGSIKWSSSIRQGIVAMSPHSFNDFFLRVGYQGYRINVLLRCYVMSPGSPSIAMTCGQALGGLVICQ